MKDTKTVLSLVIKKHQGSDTWIIGKGLSLQDLEANDIGEGVVIAINEAIIQVERLNLPNPVYSMQHDGILVVPKSPILRFSEKDLYLPDRTPSALCAVRIAELIGGKIFLKCFDACTTGDMKTCVPTTNGFKIEPANHSINGIMNDYGTLCNLLREHDVNFV